MTQLLLFDTPAAKPFAPVPPCVKEVTTTNQSIKSVRIPQNQGQQGLDGHQRGLNHMGDLARLVLLRYDLVAQRRARRLAKEATANV